MSVEAGQESRRPTTQPVLHGAVFLGDPLSRSRPPGLGRPAGVACAIGFAEPRPDVHSPGFGVYRKRTGIGSTGCPGRSWGGAIRKLFSSMASGWYLATCMRGLNGRTCINNKGPVRLY